MDNLLPPTNTSPTNEEIRKILIKNIGPPPKRKRRRLEKWKRVEGYEHYYEISNRGRVRTRKVKRGQRYAIKKILKVNKDKTLEFHSKDRKRKKFLLRKLMMSHWGKSKWN